MTTIERRYIHHARVRQDTLTKLYNSSSALRCRIERMMRQGTDDTLTTILPDAEHLQHQIDKLVIRLDGGR
jgi:hypothetical protein